MIDGAKLVRGGREEPKRDSSVRGRSIWNGGALGRGCGRSEWAVADGDAGSASSMLDRG